MSDKTERSLLPIVSISLYFAAWFDAFSYDDKFQRINYLFTGQTFTGDFPLSEKLTGIFMLLGLGIILWPFKDKSLHKWGSLSCVAFLLFILENFDDYPNIANHDMMMTFLSAGFFIIALRYLLTARFDDILTNTDYFALMRASLLIMYFFGTFHKINTGFLSDIGCWTVFYNTIPFMPEFLLGPKTGLILGGYGTLAVEAAALIMLFFPKTKYYGMLIGLLFHFIIGVAGTGTVAHFSGLAFALHMSFLSKDAPAKFLQSKFWLDINDTGRGHLYIRIPLVISLLICVIFSSIYVDVYNNQILQGEPNIGYAYIKTMWWLFSIPVMAFVLLYGRTPERPDNLMVSKVWLANIVTLMLLFNSITAYIGLKSNADLGMFSNMRTEWGQSNHYIIRKPLALFPYLDKENYIQVLDSSYPQLSMSTKTQNEDLWVHKFKVQKLFYKEYRDADGKFHWIDYEDHNGKKHRYDGLDQDHFFTQKPNWWVRNYLVFTDYVDQDPRPCSSR